ncbi:unnamed protein product [Staurois parvus]|uniref:Secreted protein n=1 Tax=Staurois parvus TaxID=386267 RepID=A0ABN9ECC5_9NEOB|nr:unnamed protein product [Staurois parvus]
MWARMVIGGWWGGQFLEPIPCMALSAAAESWLLLFSLPLALNCCREPYRGPVPVIASLPHSSPSLCTIHSPAAQAPLAVGFPPLLPTGSCKHTIDFFRMESGG